MERIGAYEAKTHLPKLIEQVREGEEVIITRHGAPVALLKGYTAAEEIDTEAVIKKIYALREKNSLGGLKLRDLIEDGRK
jgi:prevent-host-death family protein